MDDNALRAFYVACGLEPKVIESAINKRYVEPPKTARRETNLAKRLRSDRNPPNRRKGK
jgi:hypothetical protein